MLLIYFVVFVVPFGRKRGLYLPVFVKRGERLEYHGKDLLGIAVELYESGIERLRIFGKVHTDACALFIVFERAAACQREEAEH